MKAIRTGQKPSTLDALEWTDIPDAAEPGPGEIQVQLRASSLNFHDYAVVVGLIPAEKGRIPMSDGAGVVTAVGDGVDGFATGDHVVSTFFTRWENGPNPGQDGFTTVPGDGIDGYARQAVTVPAHWFTRVPAG